MTNGLIVRAGGSVSDRRLALPQGVSHIAVALFGVAALVSPAAAQSSAATATPQAQPVSSSGSADAANAGQEIVVTAQFRRQNLQDTPLAITAVNAATLEARSQTNIVDVGRYSPNVSLSQADPVQGNSITAFIRGIGQSQSSFALEPGVGVYIDDVYYGTTFGASMDLTDLDRVEVLRGPQGTLAGKNSLGGAVKLYSRKPDGKDDGFIELTYGQYNRVDLRASTGLTIADGFYARFSGVKSRRDGFFKTLDYGCVNPGQGIAATQDASNCKTGTEGGDDLSALRAAFRYHPDGSPLEINVIGDLSRDDAEPPALKLAYANNNLVRSYVAGDPFAGVSLDSRFITPAHSYTSYASFGDSGNFTAYSGTPLGPLPLQIPPGTFSDPRKNSANSWGVSGTIDYALGSNLSVKSITAYRRAWGTTVNDIDASPLTIEKQRVGNEHRQFTQELRLSGKVGHFADFTVGGFYYNANEKIDDRILAPTQGLDFITDDPIHSRSYAAFGHLELHVTDKLNLIGGIRYTKDKKDYTFVRLNPDGSAITFADFPYNVILIGLDGTKGHFSGDRVDYRFGVNYHWTDGLMTYAQISTGYKGGGINPTPFFPYQVQPFGPEKLTTYEAGWKSQFLDRHVTLNGAVFYNKYTDIQETLYGCTNPTTGAIDPCAEPVNAGNGHSKGAEVEAFLRPFGGLQIDASAGYLDFHYTKIDPATLITKDMAAPYASKWNVSAGIQYAFDMGGHGTLTPRFDYSYRSTYHFQAVNNPYNRIPAYGLVNARLTWADAQDKWSLSASATNLFNKFYAVSGAESVASFGFSSYVIGHPREWALTLKRRF